MKKPPVLYVPGLFLTLLVSLALGLSLQEDDLVFDDVGDENSASALSSTASSLLTIGDEAHQSGHDPPHQRYIDDQKSSTAEKQHRRVERLWGVPDVAVPVGHVFKLRIPKQAFSGSVDRYEILEASGRAMPRWIYWDEPASTLLGVPSSKDAGNYHLSVKAFGKRGDTAKDAFLVQVVPEKREELKHKDGKTHCADGEEQTLMAIILDAKFDSLAPLVRVDAVENLAGFLGMHTSAFSLHQQNAKESTALDSSVILTGPGNVKHRKERHLSSIQWQVGCDGHLWRHQSDLVKQLRLQAKDGTLAEVLQLPVLLWRVKTDSSSFLRNRREAGSGDFENADDYEAAYEDYGEDYEDGEEDEDGNESITELPNLPSFGSITNSARGNLPEHPHRHHHGEETIDWNTEDVIDTLEILRNQNLLNRTTSSYTSPVTTTTQLTSSPSTSTTTIMPTSSSTTSTTTTQAAPASISTTTPTTTTTTTATSITTTTTTTTSTTSTTATSTTADTTTASSNSSVSTPSTESPRSDSTEEITARTGHMENESVNVALPTAYPDFTTSVSLSTTVLHSSTAGISSNVTDKSEVETPIVFANVTTDEQTTEQATVSSSRQHSTGMASTPTAGYNSTAFWTTIIPRTSTTMGPSTTTEIRTTSPSTIPIFIDTTTTASSSTSTTVTSPATTAALTTTTTTEPTMAPTSSSTPRITTENVEYGVHNFPPRKDKRLKKVAVTAGKPLSYIIPSDTFNDLEDGNTRKLRLSLYLQGVPLKSTHWLQFNSQTQEVYGLPLENDISTWDYELVAFDSEGLNVSDRLDIHVQQHKRSRTVNHEFSIYLKIDKRNEFPTDVDWELKVIRSLAELYGDVDPHHITVRSIDINHDQSIFTWTNDSLPRSSECPEEHINHLLNVLIDKDGDPSPGLRKVLAPEIRIKRVVYQGIGQCEDMNRPEVPKVPTQGPKVNFPPVPRNQVDHVNATVGQLLVFKVPEDTFFDAEDGSSGNMKMSLLTIDRTPIPPHEWLQFDSKNQEFYGVPLRNDIGRKEYQLVVTDREGASATDGLVVVVHPAAPMQHTVEFSMTLDIPYESFAHSALQKRNFIEKLRELYRDRDTSAISLHSISNGSTVITWHNRTLPTSYCANDEVNRLRAVLVKSDNDRRSVTDEVLDVMGQKFPVKQITVIPMGICLGELTGVHSPDSYVPSIDDSTSVGTFNDDYLITFVLPAIIIAAMLILAGIIACVLYRRRRSGKMSVSEQDDERQSFRSKGIPVIFQDELDEKPDPGNKSPVILKEEKPPLPPPEYQKTEDGADMPMLPKENSEEPYQPPPPFATNRDTNRQNRPKPTPTYRKPPPYVPP